MKGKLLPLTGLFAFLVLSVVWASPSGSTATNWNPFFGPTDFYRLDPTTPGVNSDVHAQFNIATPSANHTDLFGGRITFGDPDVVIAGAGAVPGTGAYMGSLNTVAILGLANEGCNNQVPITFNFVEANVVVSASGMTPNVTLTSPIGAGDTSFIYTSTGDPIGPSDSNPAHTRAEIEIDSEQMLVTTITEGTNTYSNVTRGWNGTAAAAHAAGAQVRKVNIIFPAGPASNLLANVAEDDGDLDNNGTAEFPSLAGNQIADGADAVPSFVRDSLDPNGNPDDGGAIQAHARYFGVAFVAGTLISVLQPVIMAPGSLTILPNLSWASAAWGYASVMLWQDPLAPPSNSAISDFCNFTSNTFLFGTTHDNSCTGVSPPVGCTGAGAGFTLRLAQDGGCPGTTTPNECGSARSTNPATAQRVRFYEYTVSQRDYDNDGHENALDTCPYHPNASWNPRNFNVSSGGDGDSDGLPDACDPAPAVSNSDQDGDGWQNRIDNCPTITNAAPDGGGGTTPNAFQFDQDISAGVSVPDGGPRSDSIGPACDVAGNSCGGCPALTPTGANGHYHAAYATQTICIGGATSACSATVDDDGDGVVNARDTCQGGANPPALFTGASGADTLSVAAGAGATSITVGDVTGFSVFSPIVINSPLETVRYITNIVSNTLSLDTALSAAHGIGDPVAQVMFAQSPGDFDANGFADTIDVSLVAASFASEGGNPAADPGYQGRVDVNYDSIIDMEDVSLIAGLFGSTC